MSLFLIEKRFGTIAIDKGYITTEQLIEALSIQHREDLSRSMHRPVAQILLDLGHLNATQIHVVLDQMGLPQALYRLLIKGPHEAALPAASNADRRLAVTDEAGE